ncbi:alpha/beta fold hydrolase [Helicovermis profundi]|uniref:Maspardin n=1 Tax=Helicovermis profundi TaxID=3065157 RepID=A0AAU9E2T5_9FIRM|nr:hypothetical protein HLPR_05460 [Clostridia bacterium S502]
MTKIDEYIFKVIHDENLAKEAEFYNKEEERTLDFEGTSISYLVIGDSKKTLLMLPGTTGNSVTFLRYISELSKDYKLILVNYPQVNSIEELKNGILKVIEKEITSEFYIFSHSLGGILSQFILKEIGEKVKGLIIAHSSTINNTISKKIRKENLASIQRFTNSIKGMFYKLFIRNFIKRIRKGVVASNVDNFEFWEEIYAKILSESSKKGLLSIYNCLEEFWKSYSFEKKDFVNFIGKAIIIESETDVIHDMPEKEALKTLFINSSYIEFKGSSNMSIIRNQDKFLDVIKENFK